MNEIQKTTDFEKLYGDVCVIIEQARDNAYRAVNLQLTLRNWFIGERLPKKSFKEKRVQRMASKSSQNSLRN